MAGAAAGLGYRRIRGCGRPDGDGAGLAARFSERAEPIRGRFTMAGRPAECRPMTGGAGGGSAVADAVGRYDRGRRAAFRRLGGPVPAVSSAELVAACSAAGCCAPPCGGGVAQHESLWQRRAAAVARQHQCRSAMDGVEMLNASEDDARPAGRADVALFRYSLIRTLADPGLISDRARPAGAGDRRRGAPGPFGEPVTVSRARLDRWIRAWRAGGFDALIPPEAPGHPADRRRGAGDGRRR